MKKLANALFILCALISCAQKPSNNNTADIIQTLPPKEFAKQLNKEKGILIDVRTPGEWKKGHLKDARHLDIFRDDFEAEINKLDTNRTYYVYCASGGRSSEAAEMMHQKGVNKVVDLDGGFVRWKNEGLPYEQ